MEESAFNALAEAELARIESALEDCGVDLDIEPKPGGILELEFENGLGSGEDYHYAEYAPPTPSIAPDWLQEMFAGDGLPAMEAETEAIPPAPVTRSQLPGFPAQTPAPVEDRLPTPIRR